MRLASGIRRRVWISTTCDNARGMEKFVNMLRYKISRIFILALTLGISEPGCDSSGSLKLTTNEAAVTDPCTAPTNAVACENSKVGNPTSQWEIDTDGDDVGDGANDGDPNLQGFATD